MNPVLFGMSRALIFTAMYLLSIAVHELGHYLMYWATFGERPTMKFRRKRFRFDIVMGIEKLRTGHDKAGVAVAGIIFGYMVVALSMHVMYSMEVLLFFVLYTIGCWHDMKVIWGSL